MLKNLKKASHKLSYEVRTMSGLVNNIYNDPDFFKDEDENPEEIFKYYAVLSLAYYQMKDLVRCFEKLKQMCLDEIDGTYFEKHEEDYLEFYEDKDPIELTIYNNVLLNINEGTYNITKPITEIIEKIAIKDLAMSQAFSKFFPSVKKYKEKNGEMIEVEENEVESGILSKAYGIQNYILDCHSNLVEKIKLICESKGNVGKIIEIIDAN